MTVKCRYCLLLIVFLLARCPALFATETLSQTTIDEEDILLLDVVLNNATLARSIDAYLVDEKLLLAIDPLFDALKIRYIITEKKLTVWKENKLYEYTLGAADESEAKFRWATDGFFFFTDLSLFKSLFPTKMEYLDRQLQLKISVPEKTALFPYQKIQQQNKQRLLEQTLRGSASSGKEQVPITIPDQYQLITMPHGRVNMAIEKDRDETDTNSSLQLTSDLLYHSAEMTLTDSSDSEVSARLTLNRYKTTPDNHILGLYDFYSLGDITGKTNSLVTNNSAGVGVSFTRQPEGYRYGNQAITLKETAPPGWEAEVFHNRTFILATTVPDNGLLIFEDLEVIYGVNNFTIKLYGPYGEKEAITKKVDLRQNALGQGDIAHSLYGLDNSHRLINDPNRSTYDATNYGFNVDYGINNSWQIGAGFARLDQEKEFYNVKNALSFPGILLENNAALDQDGNYAQLTSVVGGVFEDDSYSFSIETADDFKSDRINVEGNSQKYRGSYFKSIGNIALNFNTNYQKDDVVETFSFSNQFSGYFKRLRYNHSLTYFERSTSQFENDKSSGLVGSLGLSGSLPLGIRVSGKINYDPDAEDVILDSSDILVQKNINDSWRGKHYFTAKYLPLMDDDGTKWRLTHRVAWPTDEFQLNLSSNYDEGDDWSVQLGLQFYIGYDHRNNRVLFNNRLLDNTASLDVHTYLDRQLNGVPDPLDYDLPGVQFFGHSEWNNTVSGETGRTILPGVYAQTPFPISAKWKEGSATINNDYVVYTHPGSYLDVNMPFILSTDVSGFVLRTKGGKEIGLQNVTVQLFNAFDELLIAKETDRDGYYEFNNLVPGNYIVRLASETLIEKRYTSDTIGVSITTRGNGGYVELPAFKVHRTTEDNIRSKEEIALFVINEENADIVVWDKDESKRKNYFTLPTRDKISAEHSLRVTETEPTQNQQQDPQQLSLDEQSTSNNLAPLKHSREEGVGVKNTLIFSSDLHTIPLHKVTVSYPVAKAKNVGNVIETPGLSTPSFTIQLGAFKFQEYAKNILNMLKRSGFRESSFNIIKRPSESVYRLTYGSYSSKGDGEKFARDNLPKRQAYYVRELLKTDVN